MTALLDYRLEGQRAFANDTIARLPASAFHNTEWAVMTARTGADHLGAAIASGQPYRVANAIRSMVHAPSLDQVESLANAICDTIVFNGYANRNGESAARITDARQIVATIIAELRAAIEQPLAEARELRATVDGYVRLIGLHDHQLAARLDAVGAFSERVARSMKLPASVLLDAELAGRLHDVGALEAPRSARVKDIGPARKEHERRPIAGASFLSSIPSLAHLAPIVRSHRERFDGNGYPDGLHGEEIPLASRIVSVAGAFVDLITETTQVKAMLPHDACRELTRRAGSEFDPEVVSATLHLLRFRQRTNRTA